MREAGAKRHATTTCRKMVTGNPECATDGHIRTACSAAVRDPTRNPDRALGEATEIRAGVHPLVASFRWLWVDVYRKIVAGAIEVKGLTSASRTPSPVARPVPI